MLKKLFQSHFWILIKILGPTQRQLSVKQTLGVAFGGFIVVFFMGFSTHWLRPETTWLMLASLGASSVLIFAASQAPMSQPWPVMGSHLIAAMVGVTVTMVLSDPIWMAATALFVTTILMFTLRCVHPPGAATSLIAVASAYAGHNIGYDFVLFPVLTNLVVLISFAVLFHAQHPQKRYPAYFSDSMPHLEQETDRPNLSHQAFIQSLQKMNGFVDINEEELRSFITLINNQQIQTIYKEYQVGQCFSNGKVGNQWSVVEIQDLYYNVNQKLTHIHLKPRAGKSPESLMMTPLQFKGWMAYPVEPKSSGWQRVN
jgi:CBS domain-containing membrane protein